MKHEGAPTHDPTTLAAEAPPPTRLDTTLVILALTPPVAWSLNLGLGYACVQPAASADSKMLLWVISAATLAITLAAGAGAFRALKRAHQRTNLGEAARDHVEALSVAACALSIFFSLAIIAQAIAILVLGLHDR